MPAMSRGISAELQSIDWLDPWVPLEAGKIAEGLKRELLREIATGHPLCDHPLTAVGRRVDNDDVLYLVHAEPPQLAVVHLTWSGKRETSPEWPGTSFFPTVAEWVAKCMKVDHSAAPRSSL